MNMMDWVGQTLGQYRIEAPLDAGGMGQVFRGVHTLLNRPAAIKVMRVNLADDPSLRARFLQEARSAALLRHPNIVEIYDFGDQDGHLFLVMELMTNGSLRTLLRRRVGGQPWPLSLGLDLARQAAEGLAEAHSQGMVHRDIKPDNLLLNRLKRAGQQPVSEQYQLKISDFGLAKLAAGSGLSTAGAPMGTFAYMSPEQCQAGKLDERSDLYALGVVLYQITTGYLPFQISTFEEALQKHVNVAPLPPRQVRADVPPFVEKIILRCMAKKPEERFANGTELAQALRRALEDEGLETVAPISLPPPPPVEKTTLQSPVVGGTPAPNVLTLPGASTLPRIRVLDQSGQTLRVVEVKSQGLTVGRQPGNDIVLPAQAISRQHLQVLWDGKQVIVTDLGSSNGTLLGDIRMLPQVSQTWMERQMIRVGPFWLRLEGPSPVGTQTVQKAVLQTGTTSAPATQVSATMVRSGRIGMTVNPRMLTITPGQPAKFQVTLTNLGSIVDWFTTTVEGVAPEWVQGTGQEVQLNPGMQETVDLSVNVARSANNLAREYPVTIRARSREQPNESGTVQASLTVLPFKEDAMRLEPRRASGRGNASYAISLQNSGNTPAHYELSGEDDEQAMAYQFGANPVDLEPGRETRVPLAVRTRRHWIGREQRQPFQIHARPTGSSIPMTAPGEFVNKPLLPTWLLAVVGVVVAAILVVGPIFALLQRPATGVRGLPSTPTATSQSATFQPTTDTTATANAQNTATGQSNANASATAQVNASATANATATAQALAVAQTTATAQANATATAQAASPISTGTVILGESGGPNAINLDLGTVSNTLSTGIRSGDIELIKPGDLPGASQCMLSAIGKSQLTNLGVGSFDQITPRSLERLSYNSSYLYCGNDLSNQLTTGDIFAVHTNSGNYAKVLVISYNPNFVIQIKWATYAPIGG